MSQVDQIRRDPGRFGFTLLLLLAVILVIAFSFSLGRTARVFPLIIAVPACILLLLQLGQEVWPRLARFIPFLREEAIVEIDLPDDLATAGDAQSPAEAGAAGMKEWLVVAWLVALTAGVCFLHYLVAAPVFTVAFLRLHARSSWAVTLSVTVVMWLILYGLFYRLLRVAVF